MNLTLDRYISVPPLILSSDTLLIVSVLIAIKKNR